MRRLLKKYIFALLVVVALACASYLAGTVAVPEPVPDFALRAAEIYRLEIGAAFFVAFYLATMALLLALGGKGFAEFGTKGLKVEEIVGGTDSRSQRQIFARQLEINYRTDKMLKEVHQRLEKLERSR